MRDNEVKPNGRVRGDEDALDAVFDALSDERRRFILRFVIDRSGGVGFDELADRMGEREHETDGGIPERNDHERIRGELYHVHLPKLDEVGVVEFDRERGTVVPTADERRLDLCRDLMARAGR